MENEKSAPAGRRQESSPCPRCGNDFRCGAEAGDAKCWCFDMPRLETAPRGDSCYCPACLAELSAATTPPLG